MECSRGGQARLRLQGCLLEVRAGAGQVAAIWNRSPEVSVKFVIADFFGPAKSGISAAAFYFTVHDV